MNVLLTGASGFVGRRIANVLANNTGFYLTCVVRQQSSEAFGHELKIKSLGPAVDWSDAVVGQDVVIHAAARAHILRDGVADPLAEYRRVNVEGTRDLARQAARAGVRRFIFVSSIGVNGSVSRKPFTERDNPNPTDFYAQSKLEAEQALKDIQCETGMEIVIIRPPLVYGPVAPGNFGSLVRWIDKGVPLPLGAIHNKRSLVALDNLVDLIISCLDHPAAANQVFLAGDGEDLSTTELLQGVAKAMGKPSRLVPVPAGLLMAGATVLGKRAMAQRLLGSLQVDISKARNLLGWQPPLTVEDGLKRCFPDQ